MKHVRVNVAGTYYGEDAIISMHSHRALFADEPTAGACYSGELELTMFIASNTVPRNAKIVPYVRDGDSGSWIKKSEYYIFSRSIDEASGVVRFLAYDAIYRSEEEFVQPGQIGAWPRKDKVVMLEIAKRTTGATRWQDCIDADTWNSMTGNYDVQFPGIVVSTSYKSDGATTMREVAGQIASMYAGNWIIDNSGKWRLVRLADVPPVTNYLVDENSDVIVINGVKILV